MRVQVWKDVTGALIFTAEHYTGPMPVGFTRIGWARLVLYNDDGTEQEVIW